MATTIITQTTTTMPECQNGTDNSSSLVQSCILNIHSFENAHSCMSENTQGVGNIPTHILTRT